MRSALALVVLLAAPAALADEADELHAGSVPKLVEALRSSQSFKVRATAAVALGRLGDARAAPALADALRSDDHYAVRVAAASALGRLPTPDGIPALLEALHDQDQLVRGEAVDALGRFHTQAAVYAFRDALQSEDAQARLAAVRAYGDVLRDNPSVAPFVVNALGDDDQNIAKSAESAIAGIPFEKAVPLLVGALTSGGSQVKIACAQMLSKRTDKSAVEPLTALVMAADESDDVHIAAREGLKAHREYLDVNALKSSAQMGDKESRIAALRTLAAIGDSSAPSLVDASIKDPDADVRHAAERAAVDVGGDQGRRMLEAAKARETDARAQKQIELLLKSVH
jgi:HEAT repeat protein